MISFTDSVKDELKKHIIKGENIDKNILTKTNIRKILRESFVKIGEVNDPKKENHLSFLCKNAKDANEIISYLTIIGLTPKLATRKEKIYQIYLKDEKSIIYFLDFLGAKQSSKVYDNAKNEKAIASYINRTNNFENANIKRRADASVKQVAYIKQLLKRYKIDSFDKNLADTIKYRLKYEDMSLKDLADKMKISKSCLVHRLDKIMNMA